MGLFDRLFKKKKPTSVRPPRREVSNRPPMVARETHVTLSSPSTSLPIRGPPRPGTTAQIQPQRQTISQGLADEKIQHEIEKSVKKIPKVDQKRGKGIKKVVKHKQVKHRTVGVQQAPGQDRQAQPAMSTTAKPAPASGRTEPPTVKLFEDTLGEEELFKKLAQWDKDLKKRPTVRKAGVKSPTKTVSTPSSPIQGRSGASTVSATAVSKPPKTVVQEEVMPKKAPEDTALAAREKKLKELEAKLVEREKKIKEKEEMDKVFTDLEITELEGKPPEITPKVLTELQAKEERLRQWEMEIMKRESELQKATGDKIEIETSEELFQPLKNLIFTNFIVGPSNRFAHDVALAVAKTPADAYNPLFIYSEVGLGKTHLLCAIGNYIKSKNPNTQIVYVSSEKFTNELLDYLRLGEMERFRLKYRNVDVLLIDDIQFIGGQEGTQEEFFHTFNSLYNNHKQIVITSDRPPKNIAHLKDRLRSRFEGGLIVNIKPPDLGTRTRILHEKAEKDGIYIPEEIVNYIAGKVKSNVRTLIGILNRVVAHSSLTDRDLDTSLVDEVLRDIMDEKIELPID